MNLEASISRHFTWKEALWCPQWERAAQKSDGLTDEIGSNLEKLFNQMDIVRDFFNAPIGVFCAYRPKVYNELVGGAHNSAHMYGQAVDFHVLGITCDIARDEIMAHGLLDVWNMRMERKPLSNWVHLDMRPLAPGGNRFFLP